MYYSAYASSQLKNQTVPFFSTDDGKTHLNKKWDGGDFDYRFNDLGFRSPQIKEGTDCVVTFGCSNALGVGVPEDKRFGDIIANRLGYQPYNFASVGSDFAWTAHNILLFFQNNFHKLKPKVIVVLWPDLARFSWATRNQDNDNLVHTIIPSIVKENSWEQSFMLNWSSKASLVYLLYTARAIELLCKAHKIKIVQQLTNDIDDYFNDIESLKYDYFLYNPYDHSLFWDKGRDSHIGVESHKKIAESFLQFLS